MSTSCKIFFKYGPNSEDQISCVKIIDGTSDYLVAFAKTLMEKQYSPSYFRQFTPVMAYDTPNDEMLRLLHEKGCSLQHTSESSAIVHGSAPVSNPPKPPEPIYKNLLYDALRNPELYFSSNPPPVMITTAHEEDYSLLCDLSRFSEWYDPIFTFTKNLSHDEFSNDSPSICISGACLNALPDTDLQSLTTLLDNITSVYLTVFRFESWRQKLAQIDEKPSEVLQKKEEFNYLTLRENLEIAKGVVNHIISSPEQLSLIKERISYYEKIPSDTNMYFTMLQKALDKKSPIVFDVFSHISKERVNENETKTPFVAKMYSYLIDRLKILSHEDIRARAQLSNPSLYIDFITKAPLPKMPQVAQSPNPYITGMLKNYAHLKVVEAYIKKQVFSILQGQKGSDLSRTLHILHEFLNAPNPKESDELISQYKDNLRSVIINIYSDLRRGALMQLLSGKQPGLGFDIVRDAFHELTKNTGFSDAVKVATWFPVKVFDSENNPSLVALKTEFSYDDLQKKLASGITPKIPIWFFPCDAQKNIPISLAEHARNVFYDFLCVTSAHDGVFLTKSSLDRFVDSYNGKWDEFRQLMESHIIPLTKGLEDQKTLVDYFFSITKTVSDGSLAKKHPLDFTDSGKIAIPVLKQAADIGAVELFDAIKERCPPDYIPKNFSLYYGLAKEHRTFSEIVHDRDR